jgi:hypothetical protein
MRWDEMGWDGIGWDVVGSRGGVKNENEKRK